MATSIEDTTLSLILDTGISLLTDAQIDVAKLRYSYDNPDITLWQLIKDNWIIVLAFGCAIVFLFVIFIILYRLRINTAHMKVLLEERNKAEQAQKAKTEFLFQITMMPSLWIFKCL